jgi:hypothetical protein
MRRRVIVRKRRHLRPQGRYVAKQCGHRTSSPPAIMVKSRGHPPSHLGRHWQSRAARQAIADHDSESRRDYRDPGGDRHRHSGCRDLVACLNVSQPGAPVTPCAGFSRKPEDPDFFSITGTAATVAGSHPSHYEQGCNYCWEVNVSVAVLPSGNQFDIWGGARHVRFFKIASRESFMVQ